MKQIENPPTLKASKSGDRQCSLPGSTTSRRRLLRAVGVGMFGGGGAFAASCNSTNYGDELYTLRLAAFGKDVMWMPSNRAISLAMLEAARIEPSDVVYDLGSGDGMIPILAAQHFGARAVGIEYNPDLVALSRRNAARAGVSDRVSFRQGDIFREDFSEASVVTLYLGEDLNQRLRPRLEALKPGTRVVSNRFSLGSWAPDEVIDKVSNEYAMLWIVPAQVGGLWQVLTPGESVPERIEIIQSNQLLELRTGSGYFYDVVGQGRLRGQSINIVLETKGTLKLSASGTAKVERIEAFATLPSGSGKSSAPIPLILERLGVRPNITSP
jgi:precorrin-6B methylase 2